MLNKINSTFGQRAAPHCNQELENNNIINCFPVAKKGNKSKGLFKGNQTTVLSHSYGLELQLQMIIFKGVFPEGWILAELLCLSGSCWGNLDCQCCSISCCGRITANCRLQGCCSSSPAAQSWGHSFLPTPSWCFLGGGLLRHCSCALFQERGKVAGSRRDAARREGSHDFPGTRTAETGTALSSRAGGGPAAPARPCSSTSRHWEQRSKPSPQNHPLCL